MTPYLRAVAAAFAALILALGAAPAQAACELSIKHLNATEFGGHDGRGYEVFHFGQHSQTVEFTVERTKGSCSFRLGVTAGQSNNFAGRQLRAAGQVLNYQLYQSAASGAVLKDVPLASDEELLVGSLSGSQTSATFRLVFVIPFSQIVPPGTYRDTVVVRAYEGTLQAPQLRAQAQLQLSARVPVTAEFCLGTGMVFDAAYRDVCEDFGELRKGAARTVMMHARSNAGYRIVLRSRNGGTLKNLDMASGGAIPYTLSFDGRQLGLAGAIPAPAVTAAGLTSAAGNMHQFMFVIGETQGAAAGTYQDVIEITLYPNR